MTISTSTHSSHTRGGSSQNSDNSPSSSSSSFSETPLEPVTRKETNSLLREMKNFSGVKFNVTHRDGACFVRARDEIEKLGQQNVIDLRDYEKVRAYTEKSLALQGITNAPERMVDIFCRNITAKASPHRLPQTIDEVKEWRHVINVKLLLDDAIKGEEPAPGERPRGKDFLSTLKGYGYDPLEVKKRADSLENDASLSGAARTAMERELFHCFKTVIKDMMAMKGYPLSELLT